MKGLLLSALAVAASPLPQPVTSLALPERMAVPQPVIASDWFVSGQLADACTLQVLGMVTDASGANLELHCAAPRAMMGNLSANIAAQGWRQRRVTVSAEIRVHADANASLWLKTQQGTATLMFDDDSEQALVSDAQTADGWQRREITLPIAAAATQVSFGVLVQGIGGVAVRDLRLKVSQPGAISPEAAHLLDAAIAIVKQHSLRDDDPRWQVLEPQLRLFASGAQHPAEVYPAIKYLLSRLGDRQSFLLTPAVAAALNQVSADTVSPVNGPHINIFTLPDGARLVLSRRAVEQAVRTAQNPAPPEALP